MAGVSQQQGGGEGLQVLGLRQLGDQALGIHIDSVLLGTGAQVQVQAALKALLDEGGVHGHQAQAVKGLRSVLWLVLII